MFVVITIESIAIEIKVQYLKPILVAFIYRPPDSSQQWIDIFETLLDKMDATNLQMYILGDFNIHYMFEKKCFKNTKWNNIVLNYGLTQLIKCPTRVSKNSSSIIDHVYSNRPDQITEISVPLYTISDHFPVCVTVAGNTNDKIKSNHKSIKYRCFNKFNENDFHLDLVNNGIDNVIYIIDPDSALDILYTILNTTLAKHAPYKEKRIKRDSQPLWFTDEIKYAIRKRNEYHMTHKFDEYKMQRNKVQSLIRKSKRNFYNNAVLNNKSTSSLWKNIKSVSGEDNNQSMTNLPTRIHYNDNLVEGRLNVLNALNSHFVNIANKINKTPFSKHNFKTLKENLDRKLTYNMFEINRIHPFEVKRLLDKLNSNKATGIDGIGPRILKLCGDYITIAIAHIINLSIDQGIFPYRFKKALVNPIFKNGNKEDPHNYRPISILPTLSKIFERHIALQMHTYFNKTNILHKTQSGFRQKHSCQTALIHLIDTWIKNIDEGRCVGAVFLDLSKAFDLVDHEILIYKLQLHHFSPKTLLLFKSYLSDRHQVIHSDNVTSDEMTITSGVPQGSILGPLLFLIYINDISHEILTGGIDLYADDSTLYEMNKQPCVVQRNLQINLNKLQDWCNLNNMSLNPNKTKCMMIATSYRHKNDKSLTLNLTLNGLRVELVTVKKILGIHVENSLSWNYQISTVCSKINSKIALFRRISSYLSNEMKLMFYNAYIMSNMEYCCVIWGTSSKAYTMMNKLQIRAAKIITNSLTPDKSKILQKIGILSFKNRCLYHAGTIIYNAQNKQTPEYISELVQFSNNSAYNLRSKANFDIQIPIQHTKYMCTSFTSFSAHVWNTIPKDVRFKPSLCSFKLALKKFLLEN